ncbi:hypothetical protein GCM10023149_29960 [Mucilaginibacter gynuensis]|uniref:Carboxypeptidase regulatory-like domain-containing protein n=2 Tax=Mucilaginibacter gynuensis TaxID=1302236 RepID=A0ABP8GMU3_9SPHI
MPLFAVDQFAVTATNTSTGVNTTAKPGEDGVYQFFDLPAGEYSINFLIAGAKVQPNGFLLTLEPDETRFLERADFRGSPLLQPATGTGTIVGHLTNVASNIGVSVLHKGNLQTYSAKTDAEGNFTFRNMPSGDYYGTINIGLGYTPVSGTKFEVTVADGERVDAGSFLFYDDADPGSPNFITYEMDGRKHFRGKTVGANYTSPNLNLWTYDTWISVSLGGGPLGGNSSKSYQMDRLDIKLDDVKGAGTYPVMGTVQSVIRYTTFARLSTGRPSSYNMIWAGTGTVTITSIDVAAKTISGTFSATLVPENVFAKGDKVISNGAFANYKY